MKTVIYVGIAFAVGYFTIGLLPWYWSLTLVGICIYNLFIKPAQAKKEKKIMEKAEKIFGKVEKIIQLRKEMAKR